MAVRHTRPYVDVAVRDFAFANSAFKKFGRFQESVVARWRVEGHAERPGNHFTYRLTADGSVLMEDFRPAKGAAMMTMFSGDGDYLIATHYCSAGNQPQMTTETIVEPQSGTLAFSLVRVTGMATPEDWHNTGLEVLMKDKTISHRNGLTRTGEKREPARFNSRDGSLRSTGKRQFLSDGAAGIIRQKAKNPAPMGTSLPVCGRGYFMVHQRSK